ncbi:MAG TPA: MXAN_5187 C-terminal domain-containing protein [Kofleriaceae bacterium]
MAAKSGQDTASTDQIEELLDAVDTTLDRLKTLYEQYFLGIQKQAPAFIHSDVERKLRDLTQINIRNTGLRYRLATLQQKFGSYNSYWRRTLRQIENGTYVRNLAKIGREAARTGSDIPEEILAAMPKRMREQVLRDRDQAIAVAKRRHQLDDAAVGDGMTLSDDESPELAEPMTELPAAPKPQKTRSGAHVISEDDGEIDYNAMFSAFDDDAPKLAPKPDAVTTQTITQPVARPQLPRMPVPSDPQTHGLPRTAAATPPGGATSAIPRPQAPQPGTGGVPRPQVPQPATGGIPRPVVPQPGTGGVPRPLAAHPGSGAVAGQAPSAGTPSSGIPRPAGQQPTGATVASTPSSGIPPAGQQQTGPTMPGTPSSGIPRPAGQQQTGPVAPATPSSGIPRPVGQQQTGPTTGGIARPTPTAGTPREQPSGPTTVAIPRPTPGAIPRPQTGPMPAIPQSIPRPAGQQGSGPTSAPPGVRPTPPAGIPRPQTGPVPAITQPIPRPAPSQQSRPIPVMPGSAAQTGSVPVESMSGPFPRTPAEKPAPTTQIPKPAPVAPRPTQSMPKPPLKPPPGMSEADVNALHAKYVKAKEMVGEKVDPGSREKLLKTINQTAPKIMEQYKASGVDFSVVVKDNQVVIKAKPKT